MSHPKRSYIFKSAYTFSIFLITVILAPSTRAQIPHHHGASHGGKVFMSGDDHFEIKKLTPKRSYQIFASDKFRKALELADFEFIKITASWDDQAKPLALKNFENSKDSFLIRTPKEMKTSGKLIIEHKRKNPPKDYVAPQSPLTIDLSQI